MYNIFTGTLLNGAAFCVNTDDLSGSINALTFNGNDLYFGGAFTKTNGKANAPNMERIRYPGAYFNGCALYRTVQAGAWNNPLTWEGNAVPPTDADVLIRHSVTVTITTVRYSISTEPGGNVNVLPGVQLNTVH